MKKNLIFLVVLLMFSFNICAQIESTVSGGYWNDPNTWVGGVVPGANNDVLILGPVVLASTSGYTILTEYCNNLTIAATGSLRNGDYGGGSGVFPLEVNGNVINGGIVENGPNDLVRIFISGDLENNNIWMPYETVLRTSDNHNLSLAPGKSFGSKITNSGCPSITALTDMLFTCDWFSGGTYQREHFYLNGQTFNVGNHSLELRRCMINSGTLYGDFEILGTFKVGYDVNDTLEFLGNITVTDTLTGGEYGGGYGIYKLKITGDLTNNGVIKDDYDTDAPLNADDFNILITGNIVNNGFWGCNFVNMIGTETQYIYQNAGKQFDSFFYDRVAGSDIQAQSDITITKDFDLNAATLNMENHTLAIKGWLYDGFISNTELLNGYLQNITCIDQLTVNGKVTVDNNNVFKGSVVVNDTLQSNEYGGGSTIFNLLIDGDITNYGLIKNINSGDVLALEINGDIYNYGLWQNSLTKFKGRQDQSVFQSQDMIFQTDFSDLDSLSNVFTSSDLRINGNFNLMRSTLQMNGHEININGTLYNGNVVSAKIKNATLSNIHGYGDTEIRGVVVIDDGNCFYGDLVVTDTLQSQVYGGGSHTYELKNYGNIENNGVIRNEPLQNENFALYVQGDIINNGAWSNYRTYQLYFPNNNTHKVSCLNTGNIDWLFNGSSITGIGAAAYSIISGGGVQTIPPGQSYELSVQYAPAGVDTTATLSMACSEIGSLENIYLIGHTYNTTVNMDEVNVPPIVNNFILYQNYPNPFNPDTKICYELMEASDISLKVYAVSGKEIATLVDGFKPAGRYEVEFCSEEIPVGVYFCKMQAGNAIAIKKMILLK